MYVNLKGGCMGNISEIREYSFLYRYTRTKKMYKVVVSDLDGTLLNSDQEVSELSKKVIRELCDRGIKFYIATGRAYPDAKRIMESIGIKNTSYFSKWRSHK